MVDTVSSVVGSVPSLRVSAEQASTARSLSANPARVQEVTSVSPESPQAPYISPYISLDYNYDKAVVQIRDSETGDVVDQFPTESRLAEQQRAQAVAEQTRQRLRQTDKNTQQQAASATSYKSLKANNNNDSASASGLKPIVTQAKASDIVSVQEATSAPAANSAPPAHIAAAALSAGASTSGAGRGSVSSLLA
ncbi:MAG: hypothetical protein KDI13_04345 [Alphaproteobacteria bacterium]|nr:hypothetical protein [Alphaproteobacteria bacterium]